MIIGKITANRETIIELEAVGSNQKREQVEAASVQVALMSQNVTYSHIFCIFSLVLGRIVDEH